MAALTADRNTARDDGDVKSLGVAASQKIFVGALVMRNAAGFAVKGASGLNLLPVGRAEEQVDNSTGAAGDKTIRARAGIFIFGNSSAGDLIAATEIGKICYAVDDQTVAKTHGASTRSPAGIVVDVDTRGVHVLVNEAMLAAVLANNKVYVPIRVGTLVGAGVFFAPAPCAGRVTRISSIIEGVLTTGDATLQAKINGVNITNGLLTITQSGSAAGDVDQAVPTGANVVAQDDKLSLTVGGSNATATVANVLVEITKD